MRRGALLIAAGLMLLIVNPGTANAATATPWPNIGRAGASAPITVRSVQYLLRAHGSGVPVTGRFGVTTAHALRSFQAQHGLPVTGRTNRPTWLALIIVIQRGAIGDAVRAVQDQLNYRNLRGTGLLPVHGIFGSRTEAAVHRLQTSWGIVSDGIVGTTTWRYLVSEYLSL